MHSIRFAGYVLLGATGATLNSQTPPPVNDGFDPNANAIVNSLAIQPDGKILMAGYFTQLHPYGYPVSGHAHIARLNHNGSVDESFGPNANGVVRVMVLQPNGQIVIGGQFTTIQPSGGGGAVARNYAARLNADGSLDPAFNPNTNGVVYAIAYQPNGQVVIGGSFTTVQPNGAASATTRNYIARFNVDGSLDTSFDPNANAPVLSLAIQTNGQIVVGGGFSTLQPGGASGLAQARHCIARINPNGSLDAGFDPEANYSVNVIMMLPNGQIIIGGAFTTLQPNGATSAQQADFLARLNADGTLDLTYMVNPLASVQAVALQPDGKLLLGGTFTSVNPVDSPAVTAINYIARINVDGSLDGTFDPGPDQAVNAIAVQQDGSVVFGGYFESLRTSTSTSSITRKFIARVTYDGSLDQTMAPDTVGSIYASVQLSNGQMVVGGSFQSINGVTQPNLARLNADGSLDTTFTPTVNGVVRSIAVGSNGQIVVGGGFTVIDGIARGFIARINSDGSLDGPFNPSANSQVNLVVPQSNGQYLISGYFTGLTPNGATVLTSTGNFARINSDGTADITFVPNPQGGSVFSIVFTSDGKMLVAGEFSGIAGFAKGYAAKLLMTGALDTTETFDPEPNGPVYALSIQSDGKVVIGGAFNAVIPQTSKAANPNTNTTTTNQYGQTITLPAAGTSASVPIYINHMARINKDGTLDATFFPDPSATVQTLALQSDGSFVVGGSMTSFAQNGNPTGTLRNYIGRVATDGTLDAGFNPDANGPVNLVSLLPSGLIVVAGSFTTLQPNGASAPSDVYHIALLNPDGSISSTFSLGAGAGTTGQVNVAALLPGEQMLVGGTFGPIIGSTQPYLFMLNPDGTPANGFNPAVDGPVNAVAVGPNGSSTPVASSYAAWLEPTAAIRYTFSGSSSGLVNAVVQQPTDQKVLVGGLFASFAGNSGYQNLVRINADGTVDKSFNPGPNGQINAILIQPDGRILIGGAFTSIITAAGVTVPISYLARLNIDGTVDTTFNPGPNAQVNSLAIQPADNKIIVGGGFSAMESTSSTTLVQRNNIARINSDGTIDTNFNPDLNGIPFAIVLLPNKQIIIGGGFSTITPNATGTAIMEEGLARLNSDGTVDTAFNPYPNGSVFAVALQPDGQVVVGGNFTSFIPNPTFTTDSNGVSIPSGTSYPVDYLARLKSNGIPDTTFNPTPNSSVTVITLASNGQMYVGGNFQAFEPNGSNVVTRRNFIARVNYPGTIDGTFDPELNSTASAIALLSDGSVFVGGNFTQVQTGSAMLLGGAFTHVGGGAAPYMVRLNADSSVDASFTSNPDGPVNAITPEVSGGTYVGGAFGNVGVQPRSNIAHLNADGSLDTSFNPGANAPVNTIAVQPDSRVLVGGAFTTIGSRPLTYLARLAPSGAPDTSFSPSVNGTVNALLIQANGQIVIGGSFTSVGGRAVGAIARLNKDGSLDTTFNPNANGTVQAVVQEADGSFVAGGSFTAIGGQPISYVAHIWASGAVDTAFNPAPNGPVNTVLVQTDGKVVFAGGFTSVGGLSRHMIARVSAATAVTQSLTVSADESTITWARGGGPAFASVEFRESTDGSHYASVGQATSTDGSTWTISGLPPTGSNSFYVLAIGIVPASQFSSSGLIETTGAVNTLATPVVSSAGQASGISGVPFSFTVAATPQAISFLASGLPPGLSINSSSGVISGTPTGAGTYKVTLTVSSATSSTTSNLAITVASSGGAAFVPSPSSSSDRLLNLSCRAQLGGSNILIAGFVVSGTGSKTVLLRAVGPGLAQFNVADAMATPELQLYTGPGSLIAQNTGWGGSSSLSSVFAQVGAFALQPSSADASAVASLAPGPYTIHVFDPSGAGGVVLAEVYDANASPLTDTLRLVNISARGSVSPGAGALIGGFVVAGSATKSVLIRGIGPGLAGFGVPGWLSDPVLSVYDSSGNLVAQNLNWASQAVSGPYQASVTASDIVAMDAAAGAFALAVGSADTALIANLPPGAYTFQVTSASNTTGEALGEVYELP
jgi:uncharacterized delta-60 repeat protein